MSILHQTSRPPQRLPYCEDGLIARGGCLTGKCYHAATRTPRTRTKTREGMCPAKCRTPPQDPRREEVFLLGWRLLMSLSGVRAQYRHSAREDSVRHALTGAHWITSPAVWSDKSGFGVG